MPRKKKKVRKKAKKNTFKIKTSTFTTFFAVLAIVVIVGIDFIQRSHNSPIRYFEPTRSIGNPQAPVRITSYVDFQSDECDMGNSIIKEYMLDFPDQIYLQVRYYPVDKNPNGLYAALYAECSSQQDKFWVFHDLLFKRQGQWGGVQKPELVFDVMAREAQLDLDMLKSCVADENTRTRVLAEKAYGEGNFVKLTPTYFINGEIVVGIVKLQEKMNEIFNTNINRFQVK